VTPSETHVSNVDLVRTSGFELVWTGRDVGVRGLSIEANFAFADSKVKD
jgi:iron complex outermembrane receptor protein